MEAANSRYQKKNCHVFVPAHTFKMFRLFVGALSQNQSIVNKGTAKIFNGKKVKDLENLTAEGQYM